MNYTWRLDRIKRKTTSDVTNAIVQTYWTKIGTNDDGIQGSFAGATPFTIESSNSENFIPYENLTSEIILGWIKSVVVNDYEQRVNSVIAKEIEDQINTETEDSESDFPWNTNTEE
tara:strand:+ start:999 stop:1346 length:348 start_codon:yes stop_codon:yes gene_type:complete